MCIFCTSEQQTIWASETLLPLSTLNAIHHYKIENLSSCIVLVSTQFAFSLMPLLHQLFEQNRSLSDSAGILKYLDNLAAGLTF
jgi:hypothetical protein